MMKKIPPKRIYKDPASFKDKSSFVYHRNKTLYRQINQEGRADIEHLYSSGLYHQLVSQKLLIPHEKVSKVYSFDHQAEIILQPKPIPVISYPFEWCFTQTKDAALLTLKILKTSLQHGLILKDASSYNIQYIGSQPIFIDIGSFTIYQQGTVWVGYKQWCEHFLGPLALAAYIDPSLLTLQRLHLDGIPLPFVVKLLPIKARLNLGLMTHIFLHAQSQKKTSFHNQKKLMSKKLSQNALIGLITNLEATVRSLKLNHASGTSQWAEYADLNPSYTPIAYNAKLSLVQKWAHSLSVKTIWDLGANTGEFSRLVGKSSNYVLSLDSDPIAVEKNYLNAKQANLNSLLPLNIDITNPSPNLGWNWSERLSFHDRSKPDLILALALVHHLVIAYNIPLSYIAKLFSQLSRHIIVEFIPLEDPQVQSLLVTRKYPPHPYTQTEFEAAFNHYYQLHKVKKLPQSLRVIYLYESRQN